MKRTWMRHAAAATALAAALALAAPARAAGWESWASGPEFARAAWQWLAGLWPAPEGDGQPAGSAPAWEKEGGCVNPNGQPACEPRSTTTSTAPNPNG
jgi:fatty acid desaturase